MVAETKGVDHAHEMFDILREKYSHLTLVGIGGAFGLSDRRDSGRSSGEETEGETWSTEDEEEIGEEENNKLLAVAKMATQRRSLQFSMTEIRC